MTKEDYSTWDIDFLLDIYGIMMDDIAYYKYTSSRKYPEKQMKRAALIKYEIKRRLFQKEANDD